MMKIRKIIKIKIEIRIDAEGFSFIKKLKDEKKIHH